jgi:hypothetical protein
MWNLLRSDSVLHFLQYVAVAGASWFPRRCEASSGDAARRCAALLTMSIYYCRRAFFTCAALTTGALLPKLLRI